jgi:cation transport ATPase
VDGVVTLEAASVNQAAMAGENLPVDKQAGGIIILAASR